MLIARSLSSPFRTYLRIRCKIHEVISKNLYDPAINCYRITSGKLIDALDGATGNDKCGAFLIPYPATGVKIKAIVSAGFYDWDHVSVTVDKKRPPNWQEMSFVKDLFFDPEVCAMQLHPPPFRICK